MVNLPVYFEQQLVGSIDVDRNGPGFTYEPEWVALRGSFPISITMPLKADRIASDIFLPWAANLLPESEQLRTLGQLLGLSRSDVIGLLSQIGGDTAGALSIGQPGRTATVQWRSLETPAELERLIEGLPSKPFLAGEEGVSMSLAGAQTKLAVAVDEAGHISVPMNGSPSTHILKPDVPQLCGSVYNEAFCLTLARRINLSAPHVTTGRAGKRTYLLVERYDRKYQSGRWRRLHQEDYCQALGRPPSAKYESNKTGIGGPTLKEMFALTRRHMPPTEILRLLDMVIFNVLACNTDAHAKNYSVMIRGNGVSARTCIRCDVRRSLGERHQKSGSQNRRQQQRRATPGKALAAICSRMWVKSKASARPCRYIGKISHRGSWRRRNGGGRDARRRTPDSLSDPTGDLRSSSSAP